MTLQPRVKSRRGGELAHLMELAWHVVRFCETPSGGTIVIAQKEGQVAAIELPKREPGETSVSWRARVEAELYASAYDPASSPPPVLFRALSADFAELVRHTEET